MEGKEFYMKYKMVCIDMDGTLLGRRKGISEENKRAIKKRMIWELK